ncbi:MAG: OmpH family outer membrane protein [Ignavibacteriota bacterium]
MVSKTKLTIITFAVFGILSLVSMKSYAQKIGVVDGQKVLDTYSEYSAAMQKMDGIIKSWQDTLSMMNKALQEKFDSYQKILETMSKDAKAKADDELKKMQSDIQAYNYQKSDQQKGEIVTVRGNLLKPIVEKVKDAINNVAKKKKLDVVLDKGNVAYVGDGVTDITSDVESALKK